MLGVKLEGMLKVRCRAGRVLGPQLREATAVARIHHELRSIQLTVAAAALLVELRLRLRGITLRKADETEQPVQPTRGIALFQVRLAILHDGALAQDGLGVIEVPASDVDHRDFEVREREVGIEVQHARQRAQAFVAAHDEMLDPWLFLNWNRQTRFVRFACARNGDVWVHADLPAAAIDERSIDRLLGLLVEGATVARRYAVEACAARPSAS